MNRQNFDKNNRVLAILYRAMKGELLNVQALANEYEVTTKTISRYLATIKNFLAENRELVGHTELQYNGQMKGYQLQFDSMLQNE